MNARSPYLASSLGHAVALGALVTLSAWQSAPVVIPGVRIVALAGAGRPGPAASPPAPVRPALEPRAEPGTQPAPEPEKKPKKEKSPPPRAAAKPIDRRGAKPARVQEIVSKGPAAPARPASARTAAGGGVGGAPGRTGEARGGVGVEVEGDPGPLGGYLGLLRDKVAAAWQPPPAVGRTGEVRAVVYFQVARGGGAPLELAVQTGSNISFFDRSALAAVLGAVPLPPLPQGWGTDSIAIKFTFTQLY